MAYSRCLNRRPSPTQRPLQPYLEASRVRVSPWALDPRHGPPSARVPHPGKGPAVLTRLCCGTPRVFSLRLEQTAPHLLQGRSCFALLPAGVRSPDPPLLGRHQVHTLASFLALCRPISLSRTLHAQTGFLALAVPCSNPERVFLTHLTVSLASGPPHCPLHSQLVLPS